MLQWSRRIVKIQDWGERSYKEAIIGEKREIPMPVMRPNTKLGRPIQEGVENGTIKIEEPMTQKW